MVTYYDETIKMTMVPEDNHSHVFIETKKFQF